MSEWYVATGKPETVAHRIVPSQERWIPERWLAVACGPTYRPSELEPAPPDHPRCKLCDRAMKKAP